MLLVRRLIALGLAANLLVAGFVGSLHFHVHSGDELPSVTAPASAGHCCGHGHGHESHGHAAHAGHCQVDLAATGEASPCSHAPGTPAEPHDHDHCSICQVLARAWLPPAVVATIGPLEYVHPLPIESTGRPAAVSLSLPLPRGPPTNV